MSPDPIPVGVVGAGNMGANHVRVYDELPGAELVEVVETDPETAEAVREQYDVDILRDVSEIERAEAVTVAVPNRLHREVAVECIEAGLDVLVEKPLAISVDDAQVIVDVADSYDVILQVGHIERFNPAVQTLAEILKDEEIIAIEAHRLGPFSEHLTEENVVLDLMIHDLDVIEALTGEPLEKMAAFEASRTTGNCDYAVVQLKFVSGTLATATASQVTHGKIRRLDVTTRDAYITMDYREQSVALQRHGRDKMSTQLNRSGYTTETVTERPFVQTREPLKNELEHFLASTENHEPPLVTGQDGVRAVELATEVVRRIEQ